MKLEKVLSEENVASLLDERKLDAIASECMEGYRDDLASRKGWEDTMRNAIRLAIQVREKKNTPWPNASNVKFPLVTIASLQFNARVFPALVTGSQLVDCKAVGPDPDNRKAERALRVSTHMSYQLLEEDVDWQDEFDKLLISIPILGCGFKKSYFCPNAGHNISENVFPENLVIDYYAKSLESAERITHTIPMSSREVTENKRLGVYLDVDLQEPRMRDDISKEEQGFTPSPKNIPHLILEQHCYLDLDEDGYPEPYIVTLDHDSEKVLRIVPRFDEGAIIYNGRQVAKIEPEHFFTKYSFIPSPDGGIYDLGFGALLGPINESVNTAINQLIDAGSLSNRPCGFIGRGARIKKGKLRFAPGEFKQINATGDDLRKNIFPLPVKEPSQVLFQLLSLLIEYGERISSVSDLMVGKTPGQNTPATTAMAALEQGQKVFSSIHKRMYLGLTRELRKLYLLNQKYLPPENYYQFLDTEDKKVYLEDYQGDPTDIRPSADPSDTSDMRRIQKAEALLQLASSSPGFNLYEVQKEYLRALKIDNIERFLPDPNGENALPPARDIEAETEMAKTQADIQYKMIKLDHELALLDMQALKLETAAMLDLAKAEAAEDGTQIDLYKAQLEEIRSKREQLAKSKEDNNGDSRGRPEGMEESSSHKMGGQVRQ